MKRYSYTENTQPLWLTPTLGAALGLLFYLAIYGITRLDPTNIGWLMQGDAATHYLGWQFFRHEPWSFPLGQLHRYGLEIAASIVYSDSIPFLAILLKPISPWLPEQFQYTGLWILLCCLLQGALAALLLNRFSQNLLFIFIGTGFFLLSPIMVFRSGGQFAWHFSLMGHWLILAAFILYFTATTRAIGLRWGLLIALAVLTHAYLAAMVAIIGAADLTRRLLQDPTFGLRALTYTAIPLLAIPILAMWQAGYFVLDGYTGGGADYYSMNLLAPLLPTASFQSTFLPSHPVATDGQYEGFNYLGLGILLLLPFALLLNLSLNQAPRTHPILRDWKTWLPLATACLLLTLYALSPRITLGTQTLLQIPYPPAVVEVFRATGRMFWPMHYALILLALVAIQRVAAQRSRHQPLVLGTLALALLLQWHDLSLIVRQRALMQDASIVYESPLRDPFWDHAANRYDRILLIPPQFSVHDFVLFTEYAARHQLAINIAYYGRPPSATARAAQDQTVADFLTGSRFNNAFYIITDSTHIPTISAHRSPHDHIFQVDGHWVLTSDATTPDSTLPE